MIEPFSCIKSPEG